MDITFTVSHETWYWKPETPDVAGEIIVTRANGQDSWEFQIVWRSNGALGAYPQIQMCDEAWPALTEIGPFFQALARLGTARPEDVTAIMTGYGWGDTTQRARDVTVNEQRHLVLAALTAALDSTLTYCDTADDEGPVDDSLPELLREALETLCRRHGGDAETLVRHRPACWEARSVVSLAAVTPGDL